MNFLRKPQYYIPTGRFYDGALSVLNVWRRLGYFPRFWQPRTFNEYFLQEKLKFSGDLALARTLTDKVELKRWLGDNGFSENIIPTFFVVGEIGELSGRLMPVQCIIKPAHSSGDQIIINERQPRQLSSPELAKIDSWLKEDYYVRGREPNYKGLIPRVIVEHLLLDDHLRPPADYKIECIQGIPFIIQVDIDRFGEHKRQLYTPEWKLLPYCTTYPSFPVLSPPPPQLQAALDIARRLSSPFRLCRVDLYLVGESGVKVGEVTFYPANCAEVFEPADGDWEAGKLISEYLYNGRR